MSTGPHLHYEVIINGKKDILFEEKLFKINKNLIKYRDLLGRKIFFTLDKKIKLDPCQTIWLSNR